jgi:hypothetical protein
MVREGKHDEYGDHRGTDVAGFAMTKAHIKGG